MSQNDSYILGIDSGTSVVKAAVFDLEGNEITVGQKNTPVLEPEPAWSEFDMKADWENTQLAIQEAIDQAGISSDQIEAVGITGKGVGCCFLNDNMEPVRNGILWNDARATAMMEDWIEDGTMDEIFDISANWLMPGDMGLLIPWLSEHDPETLENTESITLPTAWLALKLTGEFRHNPTDVYSQLDADTVTNSLGLAEKIEYSDEILDLEGISEYRDIFPDLQWPWDPNGHVTEEAAEKTGLEAGTPVVRLGWDTVAATAGVGAIEVGQANVILGTSGVIEAVLDEAGFEPKQLGLQSMHAVPDKWARLIAPMTATPHVDWFVENFAAEDEMRAEEEDRSLYDIFDEEVDKIPPGSNGIIFHPYMHESGERAPFTKTTAKGNFFGLSLQHDRYEMLRAVYEGIAFSNKHCLDVYSAEIDDVRLSGGGANSPVWCQIFADILDSTIQIPAGSEFGAKGAAWNAAFVVDIFDTRQEAVDQFCKVERVYEPNPEAVEKYEAVYEIYKDIVPNLYDPWDARAKYLSEQE